MKRRNKSFKLLVLSLLSLGSLIYLILSFGPEYKFNIINFELGSKYLFFPLVFTFVSSLVAFIFNDPRRGIFAGFFTIVFLLLRINGLTHFIFPLFLIALFIIFEFFFQRR